MFHRSYCSAVMPSCSPLDPGKGRLSDSRHVLGFRSLGRLHDDYRLEITDGELLLHEAIPPLKRLQEVKRDQVLKIRATRRREGWKPCSSQW